MITSAKFAFFPSLLSALAKPFLVTARLPSSFTLADCKPLQRHPSEIWIRMMGGGPRSFPGGISKWKWKRMQEKKAMEIEKAKLLRERQLYVMRRNAERLAALEESSERPLSRKDVPADDKIKSLADRFCKPGAEDLWTEEDGPETLRTSENPAGTADEKKRLYRGDDFSSPHSFESDGTSRPANGWKGGMRRSSEPGISREWPTSPRDYPKKDWKLTRHHSSNRR